jgi:hypothetical protein
MKRQPLLLLLLAFLGGASLLLILSSSPGESSAQEKKDGFVRHLTPAHPEKLNFAGEPVPMDLFWVRESFDRELLVNAYWHSSTFQLIKRAHRFFPIIEPILRKEGIPDDFKYLAVAESNLLPLTSSAGAQGIWQFMAATAKEYGLVVNADIDERYHPEKATLAACRYIQAARDTFGAWTLAGAAYNAGFNGIARVMKQQYAETYYDLDLNSETARYIFRILALKTIMENPESYGFIVEDQEKYMPLRIRHMEVREAIPDLPAFARQQGIAYRALKELNPWMRSHKLPHPGSTPYQISIPEKKGSWYPSAQH